MARIKNKQYTWDLRPKIRMGRSRFDLSHSHKTTFNQGDLVPILLQEVYPGDSFDVDCTHVIRTSTPFIRPIMDNLFIDIYFFFVPNRLAFDKWEEVMGENKSGPWAPASTPLCPTFYVPTMATAGPGTIANFLGVVNQINVGSAAIYNDIPFRDYALIWNEWFRNENIQSPVNVNTGLGNVALNTNAFSAANYHGLVAKSCKLKDYFTLGLPAPQKGDAVSIPVGPIAPVAALGPAAVDGNSYNDIWSSAVQKAGIGNGIERWSFSPSIGQISNGGFISPGVNHLLGFDTDGTIKSDSTNPSFANYSIGFNNLYAGLDVGNINDLRFAFQMQKMLEKDARGGTRYREYLESHFGTIAPDARVQVPEFLGGKRMPLSITQVTQTSESTSGSPLAQVGAFSLSSGRCGFNKGFVEHGFVMGLATVRQHHTYQQGMEKFWFKRGRYDFYDPVFANIGEQPIYVQEIYANQSTPKGKIFAWNEAYADLRFKPSRISGMLRSGSGSGLDVWHLGDEFSSEPSLNSAFIEENSDGIDRCLAAPSTTIDNFIADFYFDFKAIRVLPTYSIPGLADHH